MYQNFSISHYDLLHFPKMEENLLKLWSLWKIIYQSLFTDPLSILLLEKSFFLKFCCYQVWTMCDKMSGTLTCSFLYGPVLNPLVNSDGKCSLTHLANEMIANYKAGTFTFLSHQKNGPQCLHQFIVKNQQLHLIKFSIKLITLW